ncbi:MAG: PilZ domain-containing protein [Terracidiphilus sp.]
MRRFDYRVPRIPIDLPILLTQGDSKQPGRCKEISIDGMKVEFREPVSPGSSGTVDLSYENLSLEIPVRVARCEPDCDAVQFIYESNEQREAVARFVTLVTGPRPCTSLTVND